MKKLLILFTLIIAIVIGGYFLFKDYILPGIIAESVVTDKPLPSYLPKKVGKTVDAVKKNVDENVDQIPSMLKELNLDFNDLLYMVENIKAKEVLKAQNEIYNTHVKSTDQAFDIIKKNIHIEGYDLEMFRSLFNKKLTVKKINRISNAIEKNQLQTSISIPTARKTAKQILLTNREKIETELKKINGN